MVVCVFFDLFAFQWSNSMVPARLGSLYKLRLYGSWTRVWYSGESQVGCFGAFRGAEIGWLRGCLAYQTGPASCGLARRTNARRLVQNAICRFAVSVLDSRLSSILLTGKDGFCEPFLLRKRVVSAEKGQHGELGRREKHTIDPRLASSRAPRHAPQRRAAHAAQHAVLLLAHLRQHYNPIPVVFHPPRPRDAIGQMIDAHNAAHAAAEAADLAVNNRVMSDGTMPGLEPSLALQRRVQQGTEADEAFVGGEVPPLAPSPEVRRAAAAEAAQRRFDSLRPRG